MVSYEWDFLTALGYGKLWLRGLFYTVGLSAAVIPIGTLLAALLTVGHRSPFTPLRLACRAYIDVFRAIPALVLLVTLYFTLPLLIGVRLTPFVTALVGLSLNLAPFAAECIRAGVDSVPTIQYESATVMGFRGWQLYYYIIGPQAVRRIVPPLAGQYITTIKLTSLAAVIGVPEIWNVTGQVVINTSLPLEARLVGTGLYVALIMPLLWLLYFVERRYEVRGLGNLGER